MVGSSFLKLISVTPVALAATTFDASMVTATAMPQPPIVVGLGTALATEEPATEFEMFPGASARLEFLRNLDEDHDGEGAAAPSSESFNSAAMFLRFLPFYAPDPTVGVDSDGYAVVEFHDVDEFGQIIFRPDRVVEVFHESARAGTVGFMGKLDDAAVRTRFKDTFEFNLEA